MAKRLDLFRGAGHRWHMTHPTKKWELNPGELNLLRGTGLLDVDFEISSVWLDIYGKERPNPCRCELCTYAYLNDDEDEAPKAGGKDALK